MQGKIAPGLCIHDNFHLWGVIETMTNLEVLQNKIFLLTQKIGMIRANRDQSIAKLQEEIEELKLAVSILDIPEA